MNWTLINTIVAILALFLACLSLAWQIWTYYKTRDERIRGHLSITVVQIYHGKNAPALQLDLWNDGQIPVYIKSVALTWVDEEPKLGNVSTALEFEEYPAKKPPLQPGDGTKYVLACVIPNMLSKPSEQPADKVWVSVRSQKKVVLEVRGDDLKAYLSEITKHSKGSG